MSRPTIALVGGGVWAARLCELIGDPGLPAPRIRLGARRLDRLEVIAHHVRARLRSRGSAATVEAAGGFADCVEGCDVVVLMIRVGGFEARAHDERFPRAFDLAGDEGLGPGGFANGWRSLPVLEQMAADLRRLAPRARVLNLVAPLGLTTRLLLEGELPAWGLCELPRVTRRTLLAAAGGGSEELLSYCGLNHLGFFWPASAACSAVLAAARREALVSRRQLERLGAVPLHYFSRVFEPGRAGAGGGKSAEGRQPCRAERLRDLAERALDRMAEHPGAPVRELEERPTPWFEEAVLPALRGVLGREEEGFANLRNDGYLSFLPPSAVVELAGSWCGGDFRPRPPAAEPPAAVHEFLRRAEAAEALAYRALRQRRPELLAEALAALPLPIPEAVIEPLITEICRPTSQLAPAAGAQA